MQKSSFHKTIMSLLSLSVFSLAFLALLPSGLANTKCSMTFNLKSWSVFYKSGKGTGTITCDNGSRSKVALRTKGGGITFGKSDINGHGEFSTVSSIKQLYGSYSSAGGHAGVVKSASGQSLSKGSTTLDLHGSGGGVDLGFDFGSFKITSVK